MKKLLILFVSFAISACLAGCGSRAKENKEDLNTLSWEEITQKAQGQTVSWMMWQGSPYVNKYINNYVIPEVKERYNISLEISGGQGNQIVSTLMTEIEAGKDVSDVDLAWINGETFYQLREIDALYGPFTDRLPNAKFVDFDNPIISYDFQKPVNGYEAPWSLTQWAMIYNSKAVDNPPRNMAELEAYVKANPGTFTIPNEFVGMTFLKSLLIEMAGEQALYGEFDEQKYQKHAERLWDYINRIKPYFWKEGETFPSTPAALNQLFSNGEINFSMSFGTRIDQSVSDGTYPGSARVYVWDSGTIKNANYVGIPKNSGRKAGAMVVANFLLSPEAQYNKMLTKYMASNTVLAMDELPQDWQQKFEAISESDYAPPSKVLEDHALQELGPEYMIHLYEDFRTEVIQQ
jgi:putative spermidine/putrescine transport system substrate-binding protein